MSEVMQCLAKFAATMEIGILLMQLNVWLVRCQHGEWRRWPTLRDLLS